MGIITISRGSYSRGREIAQKLSKKLGYECISREMLLKESKDFSIPEIQLTQANQNAPAVLDNLKDEKKKYTAFIREAFLEYIQRDNIVYDGFAENFFTREIPNILKVRIIANLEYRINVVMEQKNISEEKARKLIYNIDVERRKWSMYIYGIDTNDTELYDVVLHIDNLNVDDAVEFIFDLAKSPCFLSTPESKKKINKMLLAAKAYSRNSTQKD